MQDPLDLRRLEPVRAVLVEAISEENVTVRFVDYGNVETTTMENIRTLDHDFLDVAPYAIHCQLKGLPATASWSQEDIDRFEGLGDINLHEGAEKVSEKLGVGRVIVAFLDDPAGIGFAHRGRAVSRRDLGERDVAGREIGDELVARVEHGGRGGPLA